MSLDLGRILATVDIESVQFDRKYVRLVRQFADLAPKAEQAAAGTEKLDTSLAGLADTAGAAAAGTERVAKASTQASTAEQKAAAAATRHAAAQRDVAAIMERTAGLTLREQQAVLRLSAAQERLTALQSSGTATTRQLAGAQATLIGAQRSVTKAEEAAAASTSKWRGALAGTLKTAGELGLVLGGIELARKGVELIGGGKELTDALNGVQAAARASDEQMKAARAQAIGLGQDLKVPKATAIDAAQAMEDLVRSGMTLDRAMAATRPTLLLAAAANVSTADAARYLGDVLDDFALPASHATHVANSLAGAATSAGGGLTEMFEAIKYAGPTSRAVGIDVDSLTAAVAELAKGGIQGSMAGTGIRMMLVGLTKESPSAVKALRDLGVEAFDAQGRFKGLPVVIDQLHRAQERMDPKSFLSAINTAFGARASTIVASFAHRGVAGYDQFLARVKSGDVEKYAALMNRGAAAGFRQIGKEAAAGGIAVYQKFEPAIATAVSWVGEKLPGAVRAAQSMLGPFEHFIGGALTEAWHLFGGAAQFAGAVLGPVVRLLDDMKTPLGGTATLLLGAYAGFRLFSAVPGLLEGVYLKLLYARDGLVGFATTAKTTATSFVASSTGIGAAATATAAEVDTAGEAATIGWAGVLGPIGAIAVGIGLLSSLFGHNSDEAEKNKAAMQGYAQSLKQSSDLLANVNLEQTQKVLTDRGALSAINALNSANHGLNMELAQVTIAVNGSNDQFTSFLHTLYDLSHGTSFAAQGGFKVFKSYKQWLDYVNANRGVIEDAAKSAGGAAAANFKLLYTTEDLRKSLTAEQKQQLLLTSATRQAQEAANGGTGATIRQAHALGLSRTAYLDAQAAAKANTAQTQTQTQAFQLENDAVSILQQALDGLAGINLSVATAQTSVRSANLQVAASFKQNGHAINGSSKAAVANQQAVQGQVQAAQQLASAIGKKTHSTRAEIQSLKSSKTALEDELRARHQLTPAVQAYIDKLYNVKAVSDYLKKHPTALDANTDPATAKIKHLQARIRAIKQGDVPGLDANSAAAERKIKHLQARIDALRGKDIPINLNVSGRGLKSLHGTVQFAFASGGTVPGVGSTDSQPAMLTPGEEVISKGPATKNRSLLKAINSGSVVAFAQGGTVGHTRNGGPPDRGILAGLAPVVPPPPDPVETVTGVGQVTTGKVGKKKVWIYKGHRYASKTAALNARDADARKLGGGIVDTATLPGVKGIAHIIKGQTKDAREAMRLLSRAVSDAFDLKGVQKQIAAVKKQIADMRSYRSGVVSTLAGGTDLTKAGSITDLEATLQGGTSTNNAYAHEVNSLRRRARGNKTLLGLINQLAASGQTATLQTLAGSSAGDLARITKDTGAYNRSLSAGGNAAVLAKYGTTIPDQVAREKRLDHRQAVLINHIDRLVAAAAHLSARSVEVTIGKEVVARAVFHSHEFQGVLDELSHHLHYGHQGH